MDHSLLPKKLCLSLVRKMASKLKEFISLILEQEEDWRDATHVAGAKHLFSKLKSRVPDAILMDDDGAVINSPEEIDDDARVFWGGQDRELQNYGFSLKSNQLKNFLETEYDFIFFSSYPQTGKVSLELYFNNGDSIEATEGTFDQALQALGSLVDEKKREDRESAEVDAMQDYYDDMAQDRKDYYEGY